MPPRRPARTCSTSPRARSTACRASCRSRRTRRSRPFEPYGRSKAEAERLVEARRAAGLTVGSLRPRTLLGAGRLGLFDVIFARVRAGKRGADVRPRPQPGADVRRGGLLRRRAGRDRAQRANADYNIGSRRLRHRARGPGGADRARRLERARSSPCRSGRSAACCARSTRSGARRSTSGTGARRPQPFYFDISKARHELGWQPKRTNVDALENAYGHYVRRRGDSGASAHRRPLRGVLARLLRG